MNFFKDKVLPSLITAILLAIAGGVWQIYMVVSDVPDKFEDNKIQHERFDELLQQEIEKRVENEKKILILETKINR